MTPRLPASYPGGFVSFTVMAGALSVMLAPSIASAQASIPARLAAGAPNDRVRVMLRLAAPFAPEGGLDASSVASQRAVIASVRGRVQTLLQSLGGDATHFPTLPWVAAEVTRGQLATLAASPLVAQVDEDVVFRTSLAESVPRIAAPTVWAAGFDGEGWTVVVLDTGVDGTHSFVGPAIAGEACFSTTSNVTSSFCPGGASSSTARGSAAPCPLSMTECRHGTHVAGIAVGRDPGRGLYGVARAASLLPVQVFSAFNDPELCSPLGAPCAMAFMSDVARGLDYAMQYAGAGNANRVASVNLSLSGAIYDGWCDTAPGMPAVKEAADNLRSIGIATVVAAGNQGASGAIGSPACVSSVVSVGSTDDSADRLSSFSNHSPQLSLTAPGSVIDSSLPGGQFGGLQGTSMAAPHVAGAWAIARQFRPSAPVGEVLDAFRVTGVRVNGALPTESFTRIRVDRALQRLAPTVAPDRPLNPAVTVQGFTVTVTWQPPGGTIVETYIVEAGSSSGATDVFNGPVGLTTMVSARVAAGRYYIRVRAQNGLGTSAPSNEVVAIVVPPVPPGPPQGLRVSANGPTLTAAWSPPVSGGAAQGYIVQAGSSPGTSDVFNGVVGSVTSAAGTVPNGTYYIRVLALNDAGVGPPSAEVTTQVTGGCSVPAAPTLAGSVTGHLASVTWTRPSSSSPIEGYILQAGSAPGASDVFNGSIGNVNSVSAMMLTGTYYVRVLAASACGVSTPSNEAALAVP
jgi:hypothetical protein